MKGWLLCAALLCACKAGSSTTGASSTSAGSVATAPAPPNGLAGEKRCKEAVAHMASFATVRPRTTQDDPPPPPNPDDPPPPPPPEDQAPGSQAAEDPALARQQAIEQARAAGILGDPLQACIKSWTNAIVDCVLAAKDRRTADDCLARR